MLKLVLPKGSLEKATLELFEAADLKVSRDSAVQYKATIDDPRVAEVRILRPQEIPMYVAEGLFDLGITGRDWIVENGAEVDVITDLRYSKATSRPTRWVLVVPEDSPIKSVKDLEGKRISTEAVGLTQRYLESHGVKADVEFSWGATEVKVPELVDAIVDITETGSSLRANKLRIVDTLMESYPQFIAKKDIGLVGMKLVAGNLPKRVRVEAETLKRRGLNAYQGVLQAIWSDERIASACVAMNNTDEISQNTDAARRFEPMKPSEIQELHAALLSASPIMCAECDGRCGRAAGTAASLGDLTRFLTYHEHHGARRWARTAYAELTEAERDWRGADLEAARAACPTRLDFAELLPEVDRLLG